MRLLETFYWLASLATAARREAAASEFLLCAELELLAQPLVPQTQFLRPVIPPRRPCA